MDNLCCPSLSLPSVGGAFVEHQWSKSAALGERVDAEWEDLPSKSSHCCKEEKLAVNLYDSELMLIQKELNSETYEFKSLLILAQTAEAMASATIVQKLRVSIGDEEMKPTGSTKRSVFAARLMQEQRCNKLCLPVDPASGTLFQVIPCEEKQCRGVFIHGGICFAKKRSIRLGRPNASLMGEKFCSNTKVRNDSATHDCSIYEEDKMDSQLEFGFRRNAQYASASISEKLAAPLFQSKRRKRVVLPERLGDFVIDIPKRMQK